MVGNKTNYWVDVLMGISFIIVGVSGIIKFKIFPWSSPLPTFWGLTKHSWAMLHDLSGIVMIALVLLHLILHARWIIETTKCLFKKKEEVCEVKPKPKKKKK